MSTLIAVYQHAHFLNINSDPETENKTIGVAFSVSRTLAGLWIEIPSPPCRSSYILPFSSQLEVHHLISFSGCFPWLQSIEICQRMARCSSIIGLKTRKIQNTNHHSNTRPTRIARHFRPHSHRKHKPSIPLFFLSKRSSRMFIPPLLISPSPIGFLFCFTHALTMHVPLIAI